MCNCGNKRNELADSESFTLTNIKPAIKSQKKFKPDVQFKYTGKTALTVIGGVTGHRYRFIASEDVQLIDYRDANSLMQVAVLTKLE